MLDTAEKVDARAERRVTALSLKATPEWSAWLDELADEACISKANLVDAAIKDWARRHTPTMRPPPRRC